MSTINTTSELQDEKESSSAHSLPYNSSLDGLRGVAVALVFLTHLTHFRGGTFGVDIFFVLSGYLITEVIRNSDARAASLGVFYFRRFVRLFPALAVVCLTSAVVFVDIGAHGDIFKDALSSILYTQSWTSALKDGFSFYLGNTWSLSVEEQFYLIWPFVWIFATRRSGANAALVLSLILLVAGVAWQIYLLHSKATYDRIYFAPDTRSESILIGAIGSIVNGIPSARILLGRLINRVSIAPIISIAVILYYVDWFAYSSMLVSVLSLLLIAKLCMREECAEGKLLQFRPLVRLGRISYGFYLWHVPVLMFLEFNLHENVCIVLFFGLASSLLFSMISYAFIEQPALRLRSLLSREAQSRIGWLAMAASVLSIASGLAYFQWGDIQSYIHDTKLEITGYGPREYHTGDNGPLQPDGTLVMWVSLNERPDARSKAAVSGLMAETHVSSSFINVVIPPSILLSPGKHAIRIFSESGKPELPDIYLNVNRPK